MTTAEKILRAKQDYDDVYQAGQSSMIDESKIIQKAVSGNPVVVQDVSEIPHDLGIQLYSGTIEDFSGVEVVQQGANLIPPIDKATGNNYGVDWVRNSDNSITLNGTSNGSTNINIVDRTTGILLKKGTYTISGNPETSGSVRLWARKINASTVFGGTYNNTPTTFTLTEDTYVYFYITVNVGTVVDNLTIYPQLTSGAFAKEYEPYKEPIIATANTNGTVNGLRSISPVTQLYSNADVDIELTYNKSWGMDYENKAWWDMIEHKDRTVHTNAYNGWGAEYIRPPKKIIFTNSTDSNNTFAYCINLKKVEKDYFDFSNKPTGTMNGTGYYYIFYCCEKLEEIEDIGLIPQINYTYAFYNDKRLHTIAKLGANKDTTFGQAFTRCEALKNITFSDDSQIGKSIDFKDCPLSKASIINIIEHLCTDDDITGQTLTLKKSAVNEAFGINVDDETTYPAGSEYYELRYSRPNWTVAYAE